MDQSPVNLKKSGSGIARLIINRPELHNAFNYDIMKQLLARLREIEADPDCRVVILQSEGKNFSAGADLNWMKSKVGSSFEENRADAFELARLMRELYYFPKPVICRVQGAAFGGALGLIACCDIAVAADDARFCLSEVRIGLVPAVISPYVIQAMGARAARRYFLTAEKFGAASACKLGLIHEVTTLADIDREVDGIAEGLLANGPRALSEAKALIQSIAEKPLDDSLIDYTADLIARIRVSDEAQEGLGAFLEKRTASWIQKNK